MTISSTIVPVAVSTLTSLVESLSGQNVRGCYQCGKCTAGCPMARSVRLGPRQVIRAVQVGLQEDALGNELIWMCLSCQTCTARCPREVDVASIMEALRLLAVSTGVAPAVGDIATLHKLFLASIKRTGRAYELGIGGSYNLLSGRLLQNAALLPRLVARGKLGLLPESAKGAPEVKAIFERVAALESAPSSSRPPATAARAAPAWAASKQKPAGESPPARAFAYYPGCSQTASAKEYDASIRLVCREMGIGLEEIPDWTCCGALAAHMTSSLLGYALPARNLALAGHLGLPVTTPCPSCYSRLKFAQRGLADARLRPQITEALGRDVDPSVSVTPVLGALRPEEVAAAVRKPLAGLKVACYYGCLFVRPAEVAQFDDEENPQSMDQLLTAAGAEPVEWAFKTECCGASLWVARPELARRLTERIVAAARRAGADCVAVACPMCHSNLDQRQGEDEATGLPVLYFTQLLGLALGAPASALMFERHLTNPQPLLRAKGFA